MRKKQLILLFLIILWIGLALPYLCSAIEYDWQFFTGITALKTLWSWLGDLGGIIDKPIAYAIQAVVFSILTSVSSIFLFLSQDLLNFVTSSNFINIGFTHNDFVDVGLEITKNLGNIIIILSLVVIALATILKIREYGAQKTIPILILVALLINFSPVICGVVIDGSNITMNYFLEGGALKRDVAGTLWEQLKQITSYTGFKNESERFGVGIVFVVFNVVVSLVFFLFAMLFAARYVALWILVMISPLAFACYILKFTRKYFALWWNQFFQWSIIGIPAAFTLYLANTIIMMAEEGKLTGAVTGDYLSSFGIIARYLIPVTFLVAGFFMSLQTGAMGANIITGFFEKQVKAGGVLAGKAAARRTTGPVAGTTAKGIAGLARKTEKVPFLKWVTRGLETATVPALTEYAAKQRKIKKPEGWDQMSIPEKEMFTSGRGMAQDQLVLASEMKEEGTLQKSSKSFQDKMLKVAGKFRKDLRYLKEAGDIVDALPDKITKEMKIDLEMAPIDPKAIDEETGLLKRDVERRKLELKIQGIVKEFKLEDDEKSKAEDKAAGVLHIQGFKPKDISKVSKGSLKTDISRLAMRKMKSSNLQALRNSFDAETIKEALDEGRGLNTITENELKVITRENPDLVRWAYHTPAGRETLNWSDKWETLPEPAPPSGATPPSPPPPAPSRTRRKRPGVGSRRKPPRARPGVGG